MLDLTNGRVLSSMLLRLIEVLLNIKSSAEQRLSGGVENTIFDIINN